MDHEATGNDKHPGSENLIPTSMRTKEEARALGAIGGIKSGEVRREKKRMAEIYAAVLAKKYNITDEHGKEVEITGSDMIGEVIATIVKRQDSASVSMIKELREGIDGNMIEHHGLPDFSKMSDEEFDAKLADFLARHKDKLEGQ